MLLDPSNASASRVLHAVYEDGLDPRWTLAGGSATDAPSDGFCGRHLRMRGRLAVLQARSPMLGLDEPRLGAYVTFLARAARDGPLSAALQRVPLCQLNGVRREHIHLQRSGTEHDATGESGDG